jgi:predicted enzyme related to lactoylglutathione lyase
MAETVGVAATKSFALSVEELVVDSCDPSKLARFWMDVLGYELYEDEAEIASIEDPNGIGPAICFQKVPESKQVKNRVHLDLHVDEADLDAAVERLVALGATRVDEGENPEKSWVVLADLEGNEFCVVA